MPSLPQPSPAGTDRPPSPRGRGGRQKGFLLFTFSLWEKAAGLASADEGWIKLCVLLLICHLSFVICHSASADTYLRDVPQGHYAYDAVYDLIKQGITGGFPDGTYRGDQPMTRYELAAFLSKFSLSRNRANGANEKLVAELQSEVSLIKYEDDKEKKETKYNLDLEGDWRQGAAAGQSGAQSSYRLQAGAEKNFDDAASFKLDLDTMDSGFGGATRDLAREMLDFEGKVNWGRSVLAITSGPGEVLRASNTLFPFENNTFFRRPWTGASFSSSIGQADLALALLSRSTDPTGKISTSEINASLTLNWPAVKLSARPRVFYDQTGGRDLRLELAGEYRPYNIIGGSLLVGLARDADWPHGLYIKGELSLADTLTLTVQRLGNQYRQRFNYNIFDIFDRNIVDGSASAGLEFKKNISADWYAKAAADQTTPLNITTTSWVLGRNLGASADWELIDQTYGGSYSLGLKADFRL
jgi:S-layer homology domain